MCYPIQRQRSYLPFPVYRLLLYLQLIQITCSQQIDFFSFNTSIHLSRLLGRITTFAILLLANEYIYSINTPSSDKYPSTFAKAPGTLGQLIPTTSVTFTAK